MARNPEKNSSTFRRENVKFDEEIEKKSEIQLFNREKKLVIFDEKIEIRERFQSGAHELHLAMFSRGYMDQVLFAPWFSWFLGFDSKTVQRSAFCRPRRELSNAYLLAKFGFDTAENEPFKVR